MLVFELPLKICLTDKSVFTFCIVALVLNLCILIRWINIVMLSLTHPLTEYFWIIFDSGTETTVVRHPV